MPSIDLAHRPPGIAALLFAAAIFAFLSVICAVTSEGFLTADACTHYLFAKFALSEPHYLLDVWGRPLVTAVYAVPAALAGRLGVRLCSLALALACAAATYRIAKAQRYRRPQLAFIFTLAQPLVFLHSFSEMTELPFATLLAFAFLAYQQRRWIVAAVLVSLLPLARPEGFGFVLVALIAFALHRRRSCLPILLAPLVLWSVIGWQADGRSGHWWHWLIGHWPYSQQSLYPAGHPLHFVALLPVVISPFIFPAALIGIALNLRSRGSDNSRFVTAAVPLSALVVHSLLFWMGKLGSYGEARYLLVVAPFWALLSARGWEWIFDRFQWRHPLQWAGIAATLPLLANLIHPILPLRYPDHWLIAQRAANWYAASQQREFPKLIASHPGVAYFLNSPLPIWDRAMLVKRPPGTIFIWDSIYGPRNASGDLAISIDEFQRYGWTEDEMTEELLNLPLLPPGQPPPAVDSSMHGESVQWRVFRSVRRPASQARGDESPK